MNSIFAIFGRFLGMKFTPLLSEQYGSEDANEACGTMKRSEPGANVSSSKAQETIAYYENFPGL